MYKKPHIFILVVWLSCLSVSGWSQKPTYNSPFSVKGIGDLPRIGVPFNSALGGISIGVRDKGNVDYLNPASYSVRDSMSFVLNFGGQGKESDLTSSQASAKTYDMNLNHLLFSFPITRKLGFAFGFVPSTYTGYSIKEKVLKDDPLFNPDIGELEYVFKGDGGVTRFFAGASIELFDHLSLGINVNYLFGEVKKTHTLYFLNNPGTFQTKIERHTIVSDFNYDLGLQYETSFKKKENHLVVGLTGGINKKINYSLEQLDYAVLVTSGGNSYNDTVSFIDVYNQNFIMPFYLGAGFTFSGGSKWLVGVDYKYQDWSKAEIPFSKDKLVASHFIHSGIQFVPNPRDFRKYWKIVRYRAGGYYGNSYFEVNNNPLKDFGISFGVGFPIPLSRTMINVSWESGWRGSVEKNYIKEQYNIINFGISINSFWFVKRKYK